MKLRSCSLLKFQKLNVCAFVYFPFLLYAFIFLILRINHYILRKFIKHTCRSTIFCIWIKYECNILYQCLYIHVWCQLVLSNELTAFYLFCPFLDFRWAPSTVCRITHIKKITSWFSCAWKHEPEYRKWPCWIKVDALLDVDYVSSAEISTCMSFKKNRWVIFNDLIRDFAHSL